MRTPSPDLACEVLRGDGEQVQKRSRWQDSLRAAQGAQVRNSTAAFCGKGPLHDPWSHERGGESRSDELHVGTERGMHKVRTVRRREATERVDVTFLNSVSARPWDGPSKVRDVQIVSPDVSSPAAMAEAEGVDVCTSARLTS